MRVLMVVRPAAGGMRVHLDLLDRQLAALGVEIVVAGPAGSDLLADAGASGFETVEVPIVGPLHPLHDTTTSRRLRRVIRDGRFDVVHAHGFKAGLVARRAGNLTRSRCIVTAHNHVLRRADFSASRKRVYRTAERALAPEVARWIAISESVRSELLDDYGLPPERVVLVRNGIDLERFETSPERSAARAALELPTDVPLVGVASRFAPQKGLGTLLDALPALLERVPSARVVLAGDGPLEGELRERAVALGVADALVWPGRMTDMPAFFATLDVFVSPSDLEGFSLVLAEAQAAGVPTVATAAGGAAEVVEADATALVVAPGDAPALGAAVVRLLEDPALSARLARAGRARARESFSPERMAAETLAVYESALRDPKGVAGIGGRGRASSGPG